MPKVTPFRPYAIVHSSAKMPSSVLAPYQHGAIVQTNGATCDGRVGNYYIAVIEFSGKLHAGGKHRDAWSDWFGAARKRCQALNDAHEIKLMTELGCAPWAIEQAKQQNR